MPFLMRAKNLPHAGATTDFLSQPLSQLLSNGGVSQAGLTQAEAWPWLKAHGPDVLSNHARRTAWVAFLSRFQNPLVLLLFAAGKAAVEGVPVSIRKPRLAPSSWDRR